MDITIDLLNVFRPFLKIKLKILKAFQSKVWSVFGDGEEEDEDDDDLDEEVRFSSPLLLLYEMIASVRQHVISNLYALKGTPCKFRGEQTVIFQRSI